MGNHLGDLTRPVRNTCALGAIAIALLFAAGSGVLAGGGEDAEGTYACTYEERSTDCDGYDWGEWGEECMEFEAENYYDTPQEVCNSFTDDTSECAGSCCKNYEFRNVQVSSGSCP